MTVAQDDPRIDRTGKAPSQDPLEQDRSPVRDDDKANALEHDADV